MRTSALLVGIFSWCAATSTSAQLLEAQGDFQAGQTNAEQRAFAFAGGKMVVSLSADTLSGTVSFEVIAPDGRRLGSQAGGGLTMDAWPLTNSQTGQYTMTVTPHSATGHWRARVDAVPPISALYLQTLGGALMVVVAIASVVWWRFRAVVPLRWFWAGAAIWTVGVALKFATAIVLNPILVGGPGHPPKFGLSAAIVYCGLMTGIFEIGVTLVAALRWPRLAAAPERAVAVGLGAGAFEALLVALIPLAGGLIALGTGQTESALRGLALVVGCTPLFWLTGPVERVIAIAVHTAGRVLVLHAVARRTWLGFWAGFAWMSAIDAVAGAALLSGMVQSGNLWRIQLMFLPFGILSIPLVRYALARWPQPEPTTAPESPRPEPVAQG